MGEQENNKIGGGGNNAMAVDEAVAAAKGKSLGAADPRLQGISDAIRVVPHFPKPGIMFNDITELLLRPGVFKDAVDMFVERYRGMGIAAVAERAGANVVECACLIGLPKFKDFYKLNGKPVYILVESRK